VEGCGEEREGEERLMDMRLNRFCNNLARLESVLAVERANIIYIILWKSSQALFRSSSAAFASRKSAAADAS
jgi:hypothetical protein